MKKRLAFLLAICLVAPTVNIQTIFADIPSASINATPMPAEKSYKLNGINYTVTSSATQYTNGTVVVSDNTNCTISEVIIPHSIKLDNYTYTVTKIEKNAFADNKNIKSVAIGKNIKEISPYAFTNCSNLESFTVEGGSDFFSAENGILYNKIKDTLVLCPIGKKFETFTVPSKVKKIESAAFYGCDMLYSVVFNTGLIEIGDYAFANCIKLAKTSVSHTIEKIGKAAFAKTALNEILLSRNLKEIGDSAFLNTNLKSIKIPSGVEKIPYAAFYNCKSLKTVTMGDNVAAIGDYAFSNTALEAFTVPAKTKELGYCSFAGCEDLYKINMNSSLTKIGDFAFLNCRSLTEFIVERSTIELGSNLFNGCSNLVSISVSTNNPKYSDKDGILYTKDLYTLIKYPPARLDTSFEIPENTHEIVPNALADCKNISEFKVYETNKYFQASDGVLFDFDMTNLIQYPLAKIALNYTIPDYVTKISDRAFAGALFTGAFNMSLYINEIGEAAFEGCNGIVSFNVSASNKKFKSENGVLFSKDMKTLVRYPAGYSKSSYTVPESVSNIADGAFSDSKLKEIVLPAGLETIGGSAFENSALLNSISFSNDIKSIGDSAFAGCSELSQAILPKMLTELGSYTFANCPKLLSIEFTNPDGLKSAGINVLLNSNAVNKITIPSSAANKYKESFINMNIDDYENILVLKPTPEINA